MSSGITALRKIQVGQEVTKGTPVAATNRLLGQLTAKATPKFYYPDEQRATMLSKVRSLKVEELADISFDGDCTFEQILYWLMSGVLGGVTPTGAGDDKTWVFTPALAAASTYGALTLEYGDDVQAWRSEYVMPSMIEISGALGDVWKIKVSAFGRQITANAFTGALSWPTVESVIMQKSSLAIDADGGTMGATVKANTLLGFTYTINTGLYPVRYSDGTILFSQYFEGQKSAQLKVTAAFNSGMETERLLMDGSTIKLARVKGLGSLITGIIYKAIYLDIGGIYQPGSFSLLGKRENEDICEFTIESQLGATYTKGFEVTVINKAATLL